jgi:4'-phosphopantetheinyl transferase
MLNAGQDARTLAGIPVTVRWAPVAPAPDAPADDSALLTPFELTRFERLRPAAARTFLAGRHLLRDLVASLAGVDAADVSIEARCPVCGGAHGRPAVVAPASATRLRLALAHSGPAVLAAAAWDHEVGVDLERADAEPAAERDQAIATVAGASGDDALEHWTRVEAVLKADGRGLRVDPSLVRIRTAGETVEAQISDDGASYALASIDLGPGFTATVAVRS